MIALLLFACKEPTKMTIPEDVLKYQTDLAYIEDQLLLGLDNGLPNMFDVGDAYHALMNERDVECPRFNTIEGEIRDTESINGQWVDNCTTNTGVSFLGFAIYNDMSVSTEVILATMYASSLWGSFDSIAPNGDHITVGGLASMSIEPDTGYFATAINGTFWMGEEYYWMQQGSVGYNIIGHINGILEIDGGFAYDDIVLNFQKNRIDFTREQCVEGEIRIRDASGYWFSVRRNNCAPCSQVIWQEEYHVGQLCIGESLDGAVFDLLDRLEPWL